MGGKFTFSEVIVPFINCSSHYAAKDNRRYLVEEQYYDLIILLSKSLGNLYEFVNFTNSNSHTISASYPNSHISKIWKTTNFPGIIEVQFDTNTPIDKIRDFKLDLLICD